MLRNSPNSVAIAPSATRRMNFSCFIRWRIRSATESIFRLWSLQNSTSCGTRAIVPSSFMISQITPAGLRPARRARSTLASVWPARTSTPPSLARSGNMCPGRARRKGVAPRADRGVAVHPRLHGVERADRACTIQFLGLLVDHGADALAANLEDSPGALRGFDQPVAVLPLLHHRLLHVDVLARLHRLGGDARMQVIRRGDDHGVDVLAREHLAIVARGEQLGAPV